MPCVMAAGTNAPATMTAMAARKRLSDRRAVGGVFQGRLSLMIMKNKRRDWIEEQLR